MARDADARQAVDADAHAVARMHRADLVFLEIRDHVRIGERHDREQRAGRDEGADPCGAAAHLPSTGARTSV